VYKRQVFIPAPAPAPVFVPAPPAPPAPPAAPAAIKEKNEKEEKSQEGKKVESATAIVVVKPITAETPAPPAELQSQRGVAIEPITAPEKVSIKLTTSKLPVFKGTGPFIFSLGVKEVTSTAPIKDPEVAAGVRVFSQTPAICKVVSTFDKSTGRYSLRVIGVSNGQCRITAIDNGSEENFPTATEIKQQITGIPASKSANTALKNTKTSKPGVKKASYSPGK
jgi:hypothetical protein